MTVYRALLALRDALSIWRDAHERAISVRPECFVAGSSYSNVDLDEQITEAFCAVGTDELGEIARRTTSALHETDHRIGALTTHASSIPWGWTPDRLYRIRRELEVHLSTVLGELEAHFSDRLARFYAGVIALEVARLEFEVDEEVKILGVAQPRSDRVVVNVEARTAIRHLTVDGKVSV